MLPDWPDPSKSLNVSVYCLHNMDHYKTMYPGYTGIFVKSTVNRRICAVYLYIYKVHIVDHTLFRCPFAVEERAAGRLIQRPANADGVGPTGAGRHTSVPPAPRCGWALSNRQSGRRLALGVLACEDFCGDATARHSSCQARERCLAPPFPEQPRRIRSGFI